MKYVPVRSLLKPFWWDEEDWPELEMTQGVNVYEEGDEVVVEAAVPGVPADKIKVSYEQGVLRINAQTEEKEEKKKKGRTTYKREMVTSFNYATSLPKPIDSQSMEAEVKDGVIRVRAKLAEEAKARQIPVKTG